MVHTLNYETRIQDNKYSDKPFSGKYHIDFSDCCEKFVEAFENDFIQFGDSIEDCNIYLYKRSSKQEGSHSITIEDHREIEFCPFCGEEIKTQNVNTTDQRRSE